MSIINITPIVAYNNTLALKKTKRRWLSEADKQQKEAAALTLFTITKQAQECDTLLMQYLLSVCHKADVPYLLVGSRGISFIGNISMYSKKIILQLLEQVHVDKKLTTRYNSPDTSIPSSIIKDDTNYFQRTINITDNLSESNVTTTFLNIAFNTRRAATDTFFTDNSVYYGVYNTSSRTNIHSKTAKIVEFYFDKLNLLAVKGSLPVPSKSPTSALKEIEEFIKAIQHEPRRPWKKAAVDSMREFINSVRWPGHKTLCNKLEMIR